MIPLSCGASRLSSSSSSGSGSGSSSSRSRSGSGSGSGSGSSSASSSSSSSSSRYGNYTSRMPAEAIVTMQEMGTYVCCMHLFWPAVFTHTHNMKQHASLYVLHATVHTNSLVSAAARYKCRSPFCNP